MMAHTGARTGYLFQASEIGKGRDFTSCYISKGREILSFGSVKGPKRTNR